MKKWKSISPPTSKRRFEPAYETEVIPPRSEALYTEPLLPTAFVLPPPSPHSSLPRASSILSRPSALPPKIDENESLLAEPLPAGLPPANDFFPPASGSNVPITPRPFPVAKPLAKGMIHAYSPAKPSPLSRILMLADSPTGANVVGVGPSGKNMLEALMEDDREDIILDEENMGKRENPFREKGMELNAKVKAVQSEVKTTLMTKEKGKARASTESSSHQTKKRAPTGSVEKENDTKRTKLVGGSASNEGNERRTGDPKLKVGSKAPPPKTPGGAARRVPIHSSQAGKGWRG
jgi:hypothetical protein